MADTKKPVVRVSHPGAPGFEEFSPDEVANPTEAVIAFRKKHGKIQSVHPYTVRVESTSGAVKEFSITSADLDKSDKK